MPRVEKNENVNKTGRDPVVEPENSTVDDWLGQRVGRDKVGDRGFGESDIPDPMPDELLHEPDQTRHVDEMGGESPTG